MDRSGQQVFTFPISHVMSGQLNYSQRIYFCFILVIFVRVLLSSCMVSLHRCGPRASPGRRLTKGLLGEKVIVFVYCFIYVTGSLSKEWISDVE